MAGETMEDGVYAPKKVEGMAAEKKVRGDRGLVLDISLVMSLKD
jgi:hypothetical protein